MPHIVVGFFHPRIQINVGYLFAAAALLLLVGCGDTEPGANHGSPYDWLAAQIAPFHSDPRKVAFLAEEAVNAGVSSFKLVNTTQHYGRAHSNGQIELSTALRGGTGVINITHEIAHVAGFRRNCNGHHTKCWINNYLKIALRYEARFPGETWSGTTPTKRVLRNVKRFGIRM